VTIELQPTSRRARVSRWRAVLASAVALAAVASGVAAYAPGAATAATGGPIALGTKADDGAVVTGETWVDARMVDLTIVSPALLGKTAMVRLILPAHWATQPTTTWPTLWLLHGGNPEVPDYQSWTAFTDVEKFMAGRDVLTVLPSGGFSAPWSDEWNFGLPGGKKYETFHTVELTQILQRGYRSGSHRVCAGISSGGLGCLDYAARHPGMFAAVHSYSGLNNTLYPGASVFVELARVRAGESYYKLWGSPILNRNIWEQHNPYDLLPKLKGVPIYISNGDGTKGPLDTKDSVEVIEPLVDKGDRDFYAQAQKLGLNVTAHFYGAGTHNWPYWQREFHTAWPLLAKELGVPA